MKLHKNGSLKGGIRGTTALNPAKDGIGSRPAEIMMGLGFRGYIGLYKHNGKEHGNYKFRVACSRTLGNTAKEQKHIIFALI